MQVRAGELVRLDFGRLKSRLGSACEAGLIYLWPNPAESAAPAESTIWPNPAIDASQIALSGHTRLARLGLSAVRSIVSSLPIPIWNRLSVLYCFSEGAPPLQIPDSEQE